MNDKEMLNSWISSHLEQYNELLQILPEEEKAIETGKQKNISKEDLEFCKKLLEVALIKRGMAIYGYGKWYEDKIINQYKNANIEERTELETFYGKEIFCV